jgi:hypothetical protein
MAAQTQQTGLLAQLGPVLSGAMDAAVGKEIDVGKGAQLPAGIENGVAVLYSLKFDKFKEGANKDKLYFMAQAVIIAPTHHAGAKIQGRHTKIGPEPLCDTPTANKRKTTADHWKWIRDNLMSFGFNVDSVKGTPQQREAGILAGLAALVKQGTHIGFRTWKGRKQEIRQIQGKWFMVDVDEKGDQIGTPRAGPYQTKEGAEKSNPYAGREPRVMEDWLGRCDPPQGVSNSGPPQAAGVVDSTPPAPASETEPVEKFSEFQDAVADAPADETPPEAAATDDTATDDMATGEGPDLAALGTAADQKDTAAQKELLALSEQYGIRSEVGKAPSWTAAADMIRAKMDEAAPPAADDETAGDDETVGGDEESVEEPTGPTVGDTVLYKPLIKDKKSGKNVRSKTDVECEIISIDEEKQKYVLRNKKTPKTEYKGVAFDGVTVPEAVG